MKIAPLTLLWIVGSVPFGAMATSQESASTMEHIVVTAQKRTQPLADVPKSITVVSTERLTAQAINRINDLAELVPNLQVGYSPGTPEVRIRGAGSGSANVAFEQSVGMYVDGVYAGRGSQFHMALFDLQQIEVVRGPQGVLFGKNSVAGAISMISARPQNEFRTKLHTGYETKFDGHEISVSTTGPLSDTLNFRLAVQQVEEGPWVKNPLGADAETNRLRGARLTLEWQPTEVVSALFKYESSELRRSGRDFQLVDAGNFEPYFLSVDPTFEANLDFKAAKNGGFAGSNAGEEEFYESDAENVLIEVNWALRGHQLNSITSYSGYENKNSLDLDFTFLPLLYPNGVEEFDQWYQELRVSSEVGGSFEYVAGLTYQKHELKTDSSNDLNLSSVPFPPFIFFPPATNFRTFSQDSSAWSVFADLTWNITDTLRIAAGARYTTEDKDMHKTAAGGLLGATAGIPGFSFAIRDDRDEKSLDPNFSIQWDFSNDINLYVSYARATKGGGFISAGNPDDEQFEEEQASSLEVGAKTFWLAGDLQANLAIFHTTLDDLQVESFDGFEFETSNAAKSTVRGVELDFRWQLDDHWQVGGAVALLDAQYDRFPGATCAFSAPQPGCNTALPPPFRSRDAGGDDIIFSPDMSGNLYVQHAARIADNWQLSSRLGVVYAGSYYTQQDNDPNNKQESRSEWNLGFELNSTEHWRFSLYVDNITDRRSSDFIGNVPFFDGAHFANMRPPRRVRLSADYSF